MPSETILLRREADDALAVELDMTAARAEAGRTTVFSVVDLPAPFAPIRVTISPWLTSKEMPLIA